MRDERLRGNDRYPGYDVLDKRFTPSWNEQTRRVIARRLSVRGEPKFFTPTEFETVRALADRIVPQQAERDVIPVASLVDLKLSDNKSDGYRVSGMPRERDAWRLGIKAIDAEADAAHGMAFTALSHDQQDELLRRIERGEVGAPDWGTMKSADFFKKRMAHDLVLAYYSHPAAWNDVGWGGPASPRGYVRLGFNERDPWEAAEAKSGNAAEARRINRRVR